MLNVVAAVCDRRKFPGAHRAVTGFLGIATRPPKGLTEPVSKQSKNVKMQPGELPGLAARALDSREEHIIMNDDSHETNGLTRRDFIRIGATGAMGVAVYIFPEECMDMEGNRC